MNLYKPELDRKHINACSSVAHLCFTAMTLHFVGETKSIRGFLL